MRNISNKVVESPRYDPNLDPRLDSQTCSKCGRIAEYIYDGKPLCSDHLPEEAKEAATEAK